MIPIWAIKLLAGLALLAAVAGALRWAHSTVEQQGYDRRIAEEKEQTIQNFRRIEIATRNTQAEVDREKEKKDAKIRDVEGRLATALERLRQRPDRAPSAVPGSPPACTGATGAGLSGPDAGFLEREAARGNRLRAALGECYGALDAVERSREALTVPERP